jgi:hypothetical protein
MNSESERHIFDAVKYMIHADRSAAPNHITAASMLMPVICMTLPTEYQTRYVSFIDILGFTQKIAKLEENHELFEQIISINSIFGKIAQETQQTGAQLQADPVSAVSWSAFSDIIVISVPETKSKLADLYTAVVGTLRLCQRLLEIGALTRGGLAKGKLYHKEGVLFGRAVIDAYCLERNISKVPRNVVNTDVAIEWAETFGNPKGLVVLKDMIRQDQDGVWFIDLFHFPENDSIDNETHSFFCRSGDVLKRLLNETDVGLSVWSKVVWLANQYNDAKLLKRLPDCTPNHIPEFPETARQPAN